MKIQFLKLARQWYCNVDRNGSVIAFKTNGTTARALRVAAAAMVTEAEDLLRKSDVVYAAATHVEGLTKTRAK